MTEEIQELENEIKRLSLENRDLRSKLKSYEEFCKSHLHSTLDNGGFKIEDNKKPVDNSKTPLDYAPRNNKCYECDERLRNSIFENNSSIMLLIDFKTGNIIDANEAACSFYGYKKEEIAQMSIREINVLSHNEISSVVNRGTLMSKNKLYFKHKLASGEVRDVEVTSGPIKIRNNEYLYSIIHDVTEKNKKIHMLHQSEKKFKQLFNNINDALFFFKINEDGSPSNYIEVNYTACSRLGYSYNELLQLSVFDVDINSKSEILRKLRQIYKAENSTFQSTHITKDGRLIPVEINTHTFDWFDEKAILAVSRDISNRLETEKKLRQSIENHRKVMSFLPDAVFIVDSKEILFVNQYGLNLLGYGSKEDLVHRDYMTIIHPDYHKTVRERLLKIEKEDVTAPLIEEKYLKKNGEVVDVEVTAVKIPYEEGYAFLVVARDISQRKKVKHELEEKIEFERLRTEFFSNISHELRTPLNVILGSAQLFDLYIKQDSSSHNSDKYRQINKRMKQNCYRLLRLVNNIIDITKIDSGFYNIELGNCNIIELVREIVVSVEDYVKRQGLDIQFSADEDDIIIACDAEKIERILLNLLSNAIKFSKPEGKIEVKVGKNGNEVLISVTDYGIGIPKEYLGEIFNRFTQADKSLTRQNEGSGIGLSLVKSLVEMHKGRITVESTIGSIFTVYLPIRQVEEHSFTRANMDSFSGFNIERMYIEFSDIYSKQ